MTLRTLSLSLSLAALVACNLGPKGTDDSGGDDSADPAGGGGIADIQSGIIDGSVADGDEVQLSGVIATSAFTGSEEGFFVQDPGGGEWSGIYVFVQAGGDSLFIEVGDELDISGRVTEFYDWTELTITSASSATVTGTGSPVATELDPCGVDDWEPYESVLISAAPAEATAGPNQYGEVELACGLVLDDFFGPYAGEQGATWTSITGLVGYSYSTWRLFPRDAADMAGYVAGEGPPEVSCQDIRTSGYEDGTRVTLTGAVVTSAIIEDDGFFVQDPGGGEWSGLYVYIGTRAPDLQLSEGDVVDVVGTTTEFYDWTELSIESNASITVVGSDSVTVDALDACAVDDWEPWESALVSLGARTATSDPNQYGEVSLDCGPVIDDLLHSEELADGDTYEDVIGLVNYAYSLFRINPRGPEDIVGRVPGEGTAPTETTIYDIRQGLHAENTDVVIPGAVVTSEVNAYGNGFFAANVAGGEYSGIYVYLGSSYSGDLPEVGDEVTIEGEYVEYYDFSEISGATFTVTGSASVPAPVVLSSAPSDWEPYEGVEVTVQGLSVTSDADQYGEHTTSWGGLLISDIFGAAPVSNGTTYSSITGFISYSYSAYKLEIDGSGDVTE
ncbi:MAG: hypothetical protein H6741_05405 [Alphaproteobacteria bacterium]|nr:hypothetical protein [Alphaproteobacteria bacterium]MCB9792143.1 hypothetical protein [Alphaproteobacteria bacterium]